VSNLLYRRLPVGRPCGNWTAGGLEIRDTADWKSALRGSWSEGAMMESWQPAMRSHHRNLLLNNLLIVKMLYNISPLSIDLLNKSSIGKSKIVK
jgi:hypothetical protein